MGRGAALADLVSAGGTIAFSGLSDTFSYAGNGGKHVRVKADETGLEPVAAGRFRDLTDLASSPVPGAGLRWNADGTLIEYGMQQPRFSRTASLGENSGDLLVTQAGFTVWWDIFNLALPISLATGDLIIVDSQFEVRNDTTTGGGFNVEFVTGLLITNQASIPSNVDLPGDGMWLGELNGHDVNLQGHYFDTPKVGGLRMPTNFPTPHIYARVRCRSTAAIGTDYSHIMSGYGHLDCWVYPKNGV